MPDAEKEPLRDLAGQVNAYRDQAERLGHIIAGRRALECHTCGLFEDELADLNWITAFPDAPGQDTGLRFTAPDDEDDNCICPACGHPIAPQNPETQV